jgi:hypothetical protein
MKIWPMLLIVGIAGCAAATKGPEHASPAGQPCDGVVSLAADDTVDFQGGNRAPPFPLHSRIGPEYPRSGSGAGPEIDGRVVVSFAIDTAGFVPRGTVFIQSESGREFGRSICTWLRRTSFDPVVIDGRVRSVWILNSPVTFSAR